MKGNLWPPIALAAGVLLMLGGPLLVAWMPVTATWSEEDQRALQQASADFHASLHEGHKHAGSSAKSHADEHADGPGLEAAQQNYERQQARLAAAQSRGMWLLWGLRLTGVALAVLGVWGYARSRS